MKKCLNCNEECDDSKSICPKCGALVEKYIDHKQYMDVYHVGHGKKIRNYRLILWFILGLVLPYIGFMVCWILYDSDRDKAKAVLFGAIVSSIVSTFLPYILVWMFGENGNVDGDKGQQVKQLIEFYKGL